MRAARWSAWAAVFFAAPAAAQVSTGQHSGGLAFAASVGATLEINARPDEEEIIRLPVPLTLGLGNPRTTEFTIEPSAGWHTDSGTTDASGTSYTRLRLFHFFGAERRFSVAPDLEVYFKTESDPSLGFGSNIIMPGFQLGWRASEQVRVTLRTRFEFTGGEDPGVASRHRVTFRPTVFLPRAGAFSSWIRWDMSYEKNSPGRYNVEASGAMRFGPHHRMTAFVQPRIYLGDMARAANLWRLRAGLVWSLGTVSVGHGTGGNDYRTMNPGETPE